MPWVRMALKNLLRRKLRTLAALAGVAIAISSLYTLIAFQRGYEAGVQRELDRLGAHVLVAPKGCPYDAASLALHGASWPCYLKESYLKQVAATEGVQTAAPILMNALMDSAGAQEVYIGAQPSLLALKRAWRLQGRFPRLDGEFLVGATAAHTHGLHLNQNFALPGLVGHTGRAVGLLDAGQGADDGFFFMPLDAAQRLFKRQGQLTHVLVRLRDPNEMDRVVAGLRGCDAGLEMNVVPLTHLFRSIQGLVNATRALLAAVMLVALLTAGVGVSNTVLMAVAERMREIGVLRALGAAQSDVFRLIWLETVQLCTIGSLIGLGLAAGTAPSMEQWLRETLPFAPLGTLIRPEPGVALFCLGVALLLGGLAGLLPAWRASTLPPMEAIRAGGVG